MERKYDWARVQAFYDQRNSYRTCRQAFGFAAQSWVKAIKRGDITPRPRERSLTSVLASKSSRRVKKRKLVRDGILSACCSRCGITTWQGQPITIQIDHINGLREDWRVENLRMLCPNCHSQTPTFAGRNLKRRDRPGCKDEVPSCSITVAAIPGSSNGRTQASEVCYRGSSP